MNWIRIHSFDGQFSYMVNLENEDYRLPKQINTLSNFYKIQHPNNLA